MKFILSLLVFAMFGSRFAAAATFSAMALEPTDAQLVQSEFDKGAMMTFYCPGIAKASCFSTLGTEIYAQMALLMEKKIAKECGSRRLGETAGLRGGAERELWCPPTCPDPNNRLFCALFGCRRRALKEEEDDHAPDERNLETALFLATRPSDTNNLLGLFGEFPGEFPDLESEHYKCISQVGTCSMEWLTC